MKQEIKYGVDKFRKAVTALKQGVFQAKDELDKDGVIQRFKFTFELLWKTLKIFLQDKGILEKTPKECLKSAFRIGLLEVEDEAVFLDMLEDRNKTSHLYDQAESEAIFQKVKENYLPLMEALLNRLGQEEKKE